MSHGKVEGTIVHPAASNRAAIWAVSAWLRRQPRVLMATRSMAGPDGYALAQDRTGSGILDQLGVSLQIAGLNARRKGLHGVTASGNLTV